MKRILTLLALSTGALVAQTPAVTEILNNYGLSNAGTVAQGCIFIVKGSNLSDQTTSLENVPLQTTLRGVQIRITVGGSTTLAPLYYVLPQQLAGILPSNTPVGTGTLAVVNNGRTSSSAPITVVRSAFGALTLNGAGTGSAAVHDSAYALLSNSNSTNPGNAVIFYGSGVGPTAGNETVDQLGANASGDLTGIPISVEIGGKAAQVLYRGRTQFPGLDQINVVIPTLDANGYSCTVAVVIRTNNVFSNTVTIPVAPSGNTCTTQNTGGGGGNTGGSTTPTPAEINSWIERGSRTAGNVSLNRSTSYSTTDTIGAGGVTAVSTITKRDSIAGQFTRTSGPDLAKLLRNELPPGFPNLQPGPGSCVVYTAAGLTNPFPNITSVNLDAGAQLTSNGPNGAQVAPRLNNQVAGPTYNTPNSFPNTYLSAGGYTLSGPGGADVGSFSGSLTVAGELAVTNPDDFKIVNRGNAATIRWTGGEPSTVLTISGDSITSTGQGAGFVCIENTSAGQFTVPASILSQLPASQTIGAGGFNLVTRGTFSLTAGGRGNRATASGTDILILNNFWLWTFTSEYR
jgi:uncharacterized protein (TIGR03437 family)